MVSLEYLCRCLLLCQTTAESKVSILEFRISWADDKLVGSELVSLCSFLCLDTDFRVLT